ncbi:hypothetical protein [Alkalihalobacillus sp. AL-G]|uniref:hypothetical protein n=1 Tax=Alkalihalobacillus sp. AL-G TaxID=2926399 RepID=UPI00272ADE6F|nr:hypothetical protein [Alkalihalobacillus sp. AL-G]WLD91773.1 hypothetical protein MOJ78_12065 [Alkalihalobacillus sp. AL-G]
MGEKKFVAHPNSQNKFEGMITYGDRDIELSENPLISITLGERFSVWKTIVNAVVSQFVMKQMKKSSGLLYAELKGNIKEGYGFTLTVWESKAMVPFRDRGAHKFAMRFFSWVFYGGKSQAYFLTYKADDVIPTSEEAYQLVKEYGKFIDGGKLVRKAKNPAKQNILEN